MKLSNKILMVNIFCFSHNHIQGDSQPNVLTSGAYTQDHSQPEMSYKHRSDSQWLWISHYWNVQANIYVRSFNSWLYITIQNDHPQPQFILWLVFWIACVAFITSLGLSFIEVAAPIMWSSNSSTVSTFAGTLDLSLIKI